MIMATVAGDTADVGGDLHHLLYICMYLYLATYPIIRTCMCVFEKTSMSALRNPITK